MPFRAHRRRCGLDPVMMDHSVRIGDTVRRPRRDNTEFVQSVLHVLDDAGTPWAPRPLGIDELGREVISWVPGATVTSGDDMELVPLARMVRQLHDLTAGMVEGFECVIHDDLQPRNVVVQGRHPVGLIDWEQARPGRRVEDVAKLCWSFVEPTPDSDPVEIGQGWRQLTEVYGLDPLGDDLVTTVLHQMQTCAEDIERLAGAGSVRHRALAARGDHRLLYAMHRWATANERPLRNSVET